MAIYSLTLRRVVRVTGEDARKLLQDTLTCRFDDGLGGQGRWFALLSPQGKIQAEGLVTEAADAFWLDLDERLVADFLKRMKLYRLRAKVEFEDCAQLAVIWSPDGERPSAPPLVGYKDERGSRLGTRFIVPRQDVAAAPDDDDVDPLAAYNAARVASGVAELGSDFGVNEVFPHDIGMDFLGGVDFRKGCYIGQEVVSRMQHRGTARRRPVIVSGVPEGAAAGAPLLAGGREAGTVGNEVEGQSVGIVRLDRLNDMPVTVGGLPVTITLPEWASYRLGEAPIEDS